MKPTAFISVLKQLLPLGEPILVKGRPGGGKTSTIEQATEELGYDLLVMHPVVSDPTDFKGMPSTFSRNGQQVAEFLPFGDLHRMMEATAPLVVLLDDVGQSPLAVQAALMQLVLARQINGKRISDEVRFVAATNSRQDKAGVTGLITPLLDRFTVVLDMEFDLDDWCKWGIANDMPPELLSFARFRPDHFMKFEATLDMVKSPTPRSIAGMGRILSKTGISDLEVLAGAVGEGFATEFIAFRNTYLALPDIAKLWADPDTMPVPEKPDQLFALMGALAHRTDRAHFTKTIQYLKRVPPEFQVVCVKDLIARDNSMAGERAFLNWAQDNRALFGYLR